MQSVYAESIPSQSKDAGNQHQVDNSQIFKLLQAVLSSAQGSPGQIKLALTQDQANERMKVLAQDEAIGKQMMAIVSPEELRRALEQLFDMPSFPIIHLYPNDG